MAAVVGRAIARVLAYYPVTPGGLCDAIRPGQLFDVYEGYPVEGWSDPASAAEPAEPAEPTEPTEPTEPAEPTDGRKKGRRRQLGAPPVDADEIA